MITLGDNLGPGETFRGPSGPQPGPSMNPDQLATLLLHIAAGLCLPFLLLTHIFVPMGRRTLSLPTLLIMAIYVSILLAGHPLPEPGKADTIDLLTLHGMALFLGLIVQMGLRSKLQRDGSIVPSFYLGEPKWGLPRNVLVSAITAAPLALIFGEAGAVYGIVQTVALATVYGFVGRSGFLKKEANDDALSQASRMSGRGYVTQRHPQRTMPSHGQARLPR